MNKDHYKIFNLGSEAINQWQELNSDSFLDLRNLNIERFAHSRMYQNTNFSKVDFSNTLLKSHPPNDYVEALHFDESNFKNANLTNTSIVWAYMKNVDFTNAIFQNTNLSGCNLLGSNLSSEQISNGIFENVYFSWYQFEGKEFKGARLYNSKMTGVSLFGSKFIKCDFSLADLSHLRKSDYPAILNLREIMSARRNNVDPDSAKVRKGGVSFLLCNINKTTFFNSYLKGSSFNDSNIKSANFSYSDLSFAKFERCDLNSVNFANSNLSNCIFIECNFENVILDKTILNSVIFTKCKNMDKVDQKNQNFFNKETIIQNNLPLKFLQNASFSNWEIEMFNLSKLGIDNIEINKIEEHLKIIIQNQKENLLKPESNIFEEIIKAIANGNLDKAMDKLLSISNSKKSNYEDDIIMLKSRYNRVKMNLDFLYISREDFQIEMNLITKSVLRLNREIKNEA